ncbi:MAG: ECF transporter S component [Ruminococcaceae bacterium]|nr:ECF transporter S component [Oscillospiraceae bacterium]
MSKKISTKIMVFGALLTALSFIIPLTFPKLPLPQPFSVTFASHVPTLLAMLINPIMAVFTVIGSTIAFLVSLGPIVSLRAASHILFVIVGCLMLKKGINMYLTLGLCSVIHALGEVIAVYAFTPSAELGAKGGMTFLWGVVFGVTIFHHIVDCIITVPVFKALKRTKLL